MSFRLNRLLLFHILFELYLVQQTVIGSNLALLSLTNAGFVLIDISSKSYCLSAAVCALVVSDSWTTCS